MDCDGRCGLMRDYQEGYDAALVLDQHRLDSVLAELGPQKLPATFRELVIGVAQALGMNVEEVVSGG